MEEDNASVQLEDVLAVEEIWADSRQGDRPNEADLLKAFETSDVHACAAMILEEGDHPTHNATEEGDDRGEEEEDNPRHRQHRHRPKDQVTAPADENRERPGGVEVLRGPLPLGGEAGRGRHQGPQASHPPAVHHSEDGLPNPGVRLRRGAGGPEGPGGEGGVADERRLGMRRNLSRGMKHDLIDQVMKKCSRAEVRELDR